MTSMDELDARVTALEREVRVVREDAAAARVLAGGADRDVSLMTAKLDGHTATLNEHTATLNEHTATLNEHTATLNEHTATLNEHGAKLDVHKVLLDALRDTQIEQGQKIDSLEREMRRGFSMLAVGQAEIVALLSRPDDAPPPG